MSLLYKALERSAAQRRQARELADPSPAEDELPVVSLATPGPLFWRRWRRRAFRLVMLVGLPGTLLYSVHLYDEITRPAGTPALFDRLADAVAGGTVLDQAVSRVETAVGGAGDGVENIYRRLVGNAAEIGQNAGPPRTAAPAPASPSPPASPPIEVRPVVPVPAGGGSAPAAPAAPPPATVLRTARDGGPAGATAGTVPAATVPAAATAAAAAAGDRAVPVTLPAALETMLTQLGEASSPPPPPAAAPPIAAGPAVAAAVPPAVAVPPPAAAPPHDAAPAVPPPAAPPRDAGPPVPPGAAAAARTPAGTAPAAAPPARLAAAAPPDPAAVAIVLEDPAPLRMAAAGAPVLVDRAPTRPPPAAEISVTPGGAPHNRAERLRSASAALLAGQPDRAETLYREILAGRRDDPDALFGLAAALQRLGKTEEAQAVYERLLAIRPQHHAALTNLMGLIGRSDPAQAIVRLEELQQSHPGFTPILAQLAALHAGQGHTDRALALLHEAAGRNPGNPFYLYNLAVLSDRAGRAADAVAAYRRVLELAAAGGAEARALPLAEIRARLDFLTR